MVLHASRWLLRRCVREKEASEVTGRAGRVDWIEGRYVERSTCSRKEEKEERDGRTRSGRSKARARAS